MEVKWTKGRVAALATVGTVVAAVVAAYVWGPEWLRQTAVEQLGQTLGRRVKLERVEFKPLQLRVGLDGLTIFEADGRQPFVQVGQARVQLSLASLRHLAPVVESVSVTAPQVHLARLEAQRWNYSDIVARMAARPAQPSSGEPARFSVNNIALSQGVLIWDDRVSGSRHEVRDLAVALPFISNLPYVADQFTTPSLSARVDGAPFKLTGKTRPFATSHDAILNVEVDGLPLASFLSLAPFKISARLDKADLDARLALTFRQDAKGSSLRLQGQAALNDLVLHDEEEDPLVQWRALSVRLGDSEPLLNRWNIEQVTWDQPRVWLERERDGQLALVEALTPKTAQPVKAGGVPASSSAPPARSAASVAASAAAQNRSGSNLRLQLAQFLIHDGEVHWVDAAVPARQAPRAQDFTDIELAVSGISLAAGQFGDKPVPVKLLARHNQNGELSLAGQVNLPREAKPLSAALDVGLHGIELTAAQPYVADQLNVALTRGELFTDGRLEVSLPAGALPRIRFEGDASVRGLRSVDKTGGEDFLRWKTLGFKALAVQYGGQERNPKAHPLDLGVGEISLDDFFARVIVKPTGRLNLQDILRSAQAQAAAEADANAKANPNPESHPDRNESAKASASGPSPRIAIGRIVMKHGRVDFADNFIKPNYAANLTDLDGTVSALASDRSQPADLNLRGRIDHDSPLSISGKVNPLAPKLYLQLAARATDIELTRLTPYSAKYAGYPITKGKLSVDLKYLIDNGKLDAQNQVYVNQLTFGGKVDSPDAVKLPILFAIGLLTNSKGEMDVNLPISGTLSDPDFSIGGIVWRVVVNLVEKAVTAPFSLLASAFGGDAAELGYVAFAPGSTDLAPEAKSKLDTLVKVLLDRPALKLEIAGRVDPATEQEGARRAYVASRIKAQKVADLVKQGQAANSELITVSAAEYPKYLERAYLAEPFDKPRNALGMTKSLPVPEMEQLMLQHALVDEMWFKSIADARALAVKKYLDEQGHVPVDRLFLVASRLSPDGITDKGAPQRVDFTLAH